MKDAKKVAVVILGWNGKKFMEQFLPSITQYTNAGLCEIIVADNQSSDGSLQFVKDNYPNIRIIQNERNGGYAGGYNDALKQVDAEYYVLLNQDIEVTPNWVEAVITEMDKDKNIAAAQPKLLDFKDHAYFEYAGAAGGFVDKFGYSFCRGRVFATIEKDEGQYNDMKEIFWASGACLFIRSEVYWKAGALDEDFFAHQEEIDLCWRIKNLGHRIICVPQSVVYHVGGGSLPQGNPRKTYLNFRNNLMMLYKNLPTSALFPKMMFRILLDIAAAFQSLILLRNLKDAIAIFKAHFSFYKALPALQRKRKAVQNKSSAHLSNLSIVWQYFAMDNKTYSETENLQ